MSWFGSKLTFMPGSLIKREASVLEGQRVQLSCAVCFKQAIIQLEERWYCKHCGTNNPAPIDVASVSIDFARLQREWFEILDI